MEDLSPAPPLAPERAKPAIDPFAGWVPEVLADDLSAPRKQRHTARRTCDRLVEEEGHAGSYATVRGFVREWRLARRPSPGDGHPGPGWAPGTMRDACGNFVATVAGRSLEPEMLAVTLPQSRSRYCVAMRCERAECFCEGLVEVLGLVGRVPRVMVPGDATEAGRMLFGKVTESRLFSQTRAHYRFESRFRDPHSGNERGSVGNAVGLPRGKPPRPGSVRRVRGRARREAACRLRAHRPRLAQQVRGAHDEGAPRRLRGDGVPPGRALRPRRVAGGEVGQAGPRPRRRQPLLRRARLARPGPRRGSPRQQRRHTRGPQSPRRDPAQVPGGGRARQEPPLARAGDRRAAEGDRGVDHTPRHARGPRGGHRRRGGPQARRAPGATGRAAATSGFEAACEAARRIFDGGRVPDDASCDVLARRVAAGEHVGDGVDLTAYDRLVGEGARLRAA